TTAFADALAPLVAQAAGDPDLAKLAGVEKGHGFASAGHASALGARLADAFVFAGRLDEAAAFADIVTHPLLDVHVLARLHGPQGCKGVPVIRRGNTDDINRLIIQYLANVLLELRRLALSLLGYGPGLGEHCLVGVADRGHNAIELAGQSSHVG